MNCQLSRGTVQYVRRCGRLYVSLGGRRPYIGRRAECRGSARRDATGERVHSPPPCATRASNLRLATDTHTHGATAIVTGPASTRARTGQPGGLQRDVRAVRRVCGAAAAAAGAGRRRPGAPGRHVPDAVRDGVALRAQLAGAAHLAAERQEQVLHGQPLRQALGGRGRRGARPGERRAGGRRGRRARVRVHRRAGAVPLRAPRQERPLRREERGRGGAGRGALGASAAPPTARNHTSHRTRHLRPPIGPGILLRIVNYCRYIGYKPEEIEVLKASLCAIKL